MVKLGMLRARSRRLHPPKNDLERGYLVFEPGHAALGISVLDDPALEVMIDAVNGV